MSEEYLTINRTLSLTMNSDHDSVDSWTVLEFNCDKHTSNSPDDESWVELGPSPDRTTPLPFAPAEEYLRLLREAQRESNQSSARVSLASSRKGSPKSPPNSPNTELSIDEDLKGVYINYNGKEGEWVGVDKGTDWIWDWSSRPDQVPPKDWKFKHPTRKMLSMRTAKVGKIALFSREMMYTILITNVLSLIIGTGMGMWLSRRGCLMTAIKLD